jgi:hypothetical protein
MIGKTGYFSTMVHQPNADEALMITGTFEGMVTILAPGFFTRWLRQAQPPGRSLSVSK